VGVTDGEVVDSLQIGAGVSGDLHGLGDDAAW
jgi:hypothetical protein